jgi:hypothetical protein
MGRLCIWVFFWKLNLEAKVGTEIVVLGVEILECFETKTWDLSALTFISFLDLLGNFC